jgi:hypothetical protein
MLPTFPPELFHEIFDILSRSESRTPSLLSVLLVSKLFYEIAAPIFYQSLDLRYLNSERLSRLLALFSNSPQLTKTVTTVFLLRSDPFCREELRPIALKILGLCEDLNTIVMIDFYDDPLDWWDKGLPKSLTAIHVAIPRMSHDFFIHVKDSNISELSITIFGSIPSFSLDVAFTKLTWLSIFNTYPSISTTLIPLCRNLLVLELSTVYNGIDSSNNVSKCLPFVPKLIALVFYPLLLEDSKPSLLEQIGLNCQNLRYLKTTTTYFNYREDIVENWKFHQLRFLSIKERRVRGLDGRPRLEKPILSKLVRAIELSKLPSLRRFRIVSLSNVLGEQFFNEHADLLDSTGPWNEQNIEECEIALKRIGASFDTVWDHPFEWKENDYGMTRRVPWTAAFWR